MKRSAKTAQDRHLHRWHSLVISILLLGLTWVVFGKTLAHDFINYDDRIYVVRNAQVNSGLTLAGCKRAFTQSHAGNWHPLTTLSHMLDCQLFGLKPGPHHFVDVLLHSAAVVLLFLLLRQITGAIWRSAFVAAIFAIHPLRVESVAWIAERKDVLSALFFMLTLAAYARYARNPTVGRYVVMSILCACGLMSKPMLVTLPLVLLLLDYWPLQRLVDLRSFRRLLIEKLPLGIMALAVSVATFVIQEKTPGAIAQLPLLWRIENAIVSYVIYIWQIFWPANLVVFYPHPENHLLVWQVALAACFLIAITLLVFRLRKTKKYLLVGWLWYLSMLLPVIGLVEVGLQGHADRYTYLPHIGLYVALTWLIVDLAGTARYRREMFVTSAVVIIGSLAACAWKQTSYWQNGETLWTHALAITPDSDVAQTNFGIIVMERGDLDDALAHLRTALQIRSKTPHSHYDLSLALINTNLGYVLARKGSPNEAIGYWRTALEYQPGLAEAHYNLGSALFHRGQLAEAIVEYEKTLSINPDDADAHTSLGNALVQNKSLHQAVAHYQAALEIAPRSTLPLNNLAWIFSTGPDASLRNGARALELARTVDQSAEEKNAVFIRTLAAAYAESGRFEDAIETARRAWEFARAHDDVDLAREIESDVDLYRRNTPLRDPNLVDAR